MDDIKKSGKYGLQFLPKGNKGPGAVDPAFELGRQKIQQQLAKRANVFGDDDEKSSSEEGSSSDDEKEKAPKKKLPPARTATGSIQQKQAMQVMKKALEEDASIYEYDEIYDGMQEKTRQQKEKEKAAEDRKPKYIENLLKTSARRQREHEERIEREVQKEREKEGDEFKDKEEFVTSAYRKKMEELEKLKEEEARLDSIDALTEVTKQKDLSGFYRHLYRQTMEHEDKEVAKNAEPTTIKTEPADDNQRAELEREPELPEVMVKVEDDDAREPNKEDDEGKQRSRHDEEKRSDRDRDHKEKDRSDRDRDRRDDDERRRRRRREEEEEDRRRRLRRDDDDPHRRGRRDDDRDRSDRRHDSYHSRSSGSSRHHERDRDRERNRDDRRYHPYRRDDRRDRDRDRRRRTRSPSPRRDRDEDKKIVVPETSTSDIKAVPVEDTPVKVEQDVKPEEGPTGEPAKPKVNIWEKRTVGAQLEEARARFLERRGTLQVAIVVKE